MKNCQEELKHVNLEKKTSKLNQKRFDLEKS
jgi:hypothetical protein